MSEPETQGRVMGFDVRVCRNCDRCYTPTSGNQKFCPTCRQHLCFVCKRPLAEGQRRVHPGACREKKRLWDRRAQRKRKRLRGYKKPCELCLGTDHSYAICPLNADRLPG